MGALLARAVSDEALLAAWDQVRANAYHDGEPAPAIMAFESRALTNLTELAGELADGRYRPRPMTGISIRKPAGGTRDLAIGAVRDRVVERAILDVLDPIVDPTLSPWSFAYRRGLGVRDAVRSLAEAGSAVHGGSPGATSTTASTRSPAGRSSPACVTWCPIPT